MSDPMRLRTLLMEEPSAVSIELVRDHLYICAGLDGGTDVVPLTAADLVTMGISQSKALDFALTNLRDSTTVTDLREVDTLPGLWFVKASDGNAASRMAILPDLLAPVPLGGIIAAVPEPGQLLCVPLESARAIDAMQALASAVGHLEATRDSLLSDQLFWFDGSRWHPIPVHHGEEDITVLPPPDFMRTMSHVAAMDLVSVAGEA